MERQPADELRRKAEQLLKKRSGTPDLKKLPWSEVKKIVHELEVLRIELELQNEKLRNTREELERSRLKYFDLFELAPVGYFTMNSRGEIKEANQTAARMLGADRSGLIGKAFLAYVDEASRKDWLTLLNTIGKSGDKQSCELKLLRKEDAERTQYAQLEAMKAGESEDLIQVNLVDITARKQAEETLRESEAFVSKALMSSLNGLYIYDLQNGKVIFINPQYTAITGDTLDTLKSMSERRFGALFHPDERGRIEKQRKLLEQGSDNDVFELEHRLRTADGRWIWVLSRSAVFARNSSGAVTQIIGTFIDISERKRAEQALSEQQKQLHLLIDALPALISFVDKDRRYVIVNKTYERWYGRPVEELQGKTIREIMGDEAYHIVSEYIDTALSGQPVTYERVVPYRGVGPIHVRTILVPSITPDGEVKGYFALVHDITLQKENEERLRIALNERETLLAEIHHRVKNNLAVISSLLSLQVGKTPEEGIKAFIKDCQTRIRSMALIHESLYQAGDFSRLRLKDYIASLANVLLKIYRTPSGKVRLNLDIEREIYLPADCMVPCGLVLNELVSNSLKYAFPPGYDGELTIQCRILADNAGVELIVSDNGIGLPADIDIRKTDTLGLHLVVNLMERQLKGTVSVQRDKGTTFLMRFDPSRFKKS